MASKSQTVKIEFTKRDVTGTGACRKIRSKNLIPAVLYGPDYKHGLAGTISAKAVAPVANGAYRETTLLELAISDGTAASALIREVQRHPLTRQIRHIDLYQVVKGHKIKVEIPIRVLNGESAQGVKEGGLLTHNTRVVLVEVQPSDIPEEIVVDAQQLGMGAEVFVKDLELPEGVTAVTEGDILVLHISQPKSHEDGAEGEMEEESKEVEVVAKGKAAKEEE
ncbi:MAG: 50S ribosomal protein L25 [Synergistaceae bacterium]|nr:50S ribosomal protein L25 [Synergistaceae bacterium]